LIVLVYIASTINHAKTQKGVMHQFAHSKEWKRRNTYRNSCLSNDTPRL